MTEINVKLDAQMDEIVSLLASEQKIPKSEVVHNLIMQGISQTLLPTMAKLYDRGKIGLKKIAELTGIPPSDLIGEIVQLIQEPPVTPY